MNSALLRGIFLPLIILKLGGYGLRAQASGTTSPGDFSLFEPVAVQHRYQQISATELSHIGSVAVITAWSNYPSVSATLRMGGIDYSMRGTPNPLINGVTLSRTVEFATRSTFDAATAPAAEISVLARWAGGSQTYTPVLPPQRPTPPLLVANLAELQAWDGGALTIIVATSGDWHPKATLRVYRAFNADFIGGSQLLGAAVLDSGRNTVLGINANPGEVVYGELSPGVSYVPSPTGWLGDLRSPIDRDVVRFSIRRLARPAIVIAPGSRAVAPGADTTLSVSATGVGLSYQWQKDGFAILGATSDKILLRAVTAADNGLYAVTVSNSGGSVTSVSAVVDVAAVVTPPVIGPSPRDFVALAGERVSMAVSASGTNLRYQWFRKGAPLPGATSATLTLDSIRIGDSGRYSLTVYNSNHFAGVDFTLTVTPVTRLANLSVRTRIGDGTAAPALTVGLTVSGGTATDRKPILLRGAGPTLASFGVGDAAAAVQIALLRGATLVAGNDGWRGVPALTEAGTAVGAFAFSSAASLDAAVLPSIEPAGYTATIAAVGAAGTALAEIYDTTPAADFTLSVPRLTNLSALTQVGTGGDILIAGFALAGSAPKTLLIRAVGPTLAAFGVGDALTDPQLELFASGSTAAISTNDNWGTAANAPQVAASAAAVGAFALALESKDAVLLATLPPGSYTAQVSGVNNTTGAALVEIYEVP